jgi:predicted RND superfamily exporter protein
MVADNLVSSDRQTMAIYLYYDGEEEYPGRDREISAAIEQVLQPLQQHFDTVFQLGSPYVRDVISRQIKIDQETILPAALVVLLLILAVSMGRFNCAVVPLSSGTISIVMTLAFMAYMEIPVNVLTSIIPALLIIIGSTEDVHLMAEYHTGIREGQSRGGTAPAGKPVAGHTAGVYYHLRRIHFDHDQ